MKNKITSSIRKDKSDYFINVFIKCKNDLRKTWNNIRKLISGCKKICVIQSIYSNNVEHCDADGISFKYNNYFSDVANNMYNEIPESDLILWNILSGIIFNIYLPNN